MTPTEPADGTVDTILSEQEQLDAWFETLTDEQQAAVLEVDFTDIPGWMIASLIDINLRVADDAEDFKSRVPQVLRDFVERRRGADG